MDLIASIGGVPLFSTVQEALAWGAARGLNGYHTHNFQGQVGYMGGTSHIQATGLPANSNAPTQPSTPTPTPPPSTPRSRSRWSSPTTSAPASTGRSGTNTRRSHGPRFQEIPHIGFFRGVLQRSTSEDCLSRILSSLVRCKSST